MFNEINNKMLEVLNTIVWKIKKYKVNIIISVKGFIIFWMLVSFLSAPFASYTQILKMFLTGFTVFLMLSIIYYAYIAIEEDRKKLMNIWKMYFPVITLMFIFIYSIDTSVTKMKIDYYKTKLSYDITMNKNDANLTFNNYKNLIDTHLEFYKKEDVNISKITDSKIEKKEEEHYTVWYANLAVTIMNIITCFMFLWALTELTPFKEKEKTKEKYSDKYKKLS